MSTVLISTLITSVVSAGVGYLIGRRRGRAVAGFWLGFFLGFIGWIIVARMKPVGRPGMQRRMLAATGSDANLVPLQVKSAAGALVVVEPILEMVDVRAGYGSIEVLHGVTLTVNRGEVLALLGPNGGGKSTSLKVCGGLLDVTTGDVRLAGRSVLGVPADKLARLGLCTIPEGRGVFPNLTVHENLLMCTHTGANIDQIESIAYERFPRLGERRGQLAGTMSGGEQQMLAMARALSTDPAVLLLDELSMGLAPLIVGRLYEIVAQVAQSGVSVLVVEQFARTVLGIADRAAIMLHGRITRVGPPAELADELSSAYLGGKGQT